MAWSRDLSLEDVGARARKLVLVERGGNVAVAAVVAVVEAVVAVVEMMAGSGFVVEGTSVRMRVHVDASSEVVGEPFLQDSRTMAGQSERGSVAGAPS
jgi:hypothetical protein